MTNPDSGADAATNAAISVGADNCNANTLNEAETKSLRAEMRALADRLWEAREEVLKLWRQRVERDTSLLASSRWSRRQFEDHIPEVVSVLCDNLRAWPQIGRSQERERETAEAHSQHRWQQGYDMRSLTREWGHLNWCLIDSLETPPQNDEVFAAQRQARRMVSELILESTGESVSEYSRLLQAEASTRARDLEHLIAHLREEERLRGQVLREAAHDLRGSLGIVTGSASIINREQLPALDRAEVHRLLQRGVSSLHEMMTDLIDLARLEAGEERINNVFFDAADVLCDLCITAQPLADAKNLKLDCDGPDKLMVHGDEIKVRRIAQNLLLNALKYTHAGGVTLGWASHDDGRWMFMVQDTGPGLDRSEAAPIAQALADATDVARDVEGQTEGEQNPNMHQMPAPPEASNAPNSTQSNSAISSRLVKASGEGVGLSIVKRLCDLLGATLELDTQTGTGSTFRVLLPKSPL